MGCTDDVKEERHVHAAHAHMCTRAHVQTDPHTDAHLHPYIYICKHSDAHIHREPVDTSANIIKLNQNKCIRKLIRYNVSPLNVNFYNKMSTRG